MSFFVSDFDQNSTSAVLSHVLFISLTKVFLFLIFFPLVEIHLCHLKSQKGT